MKVKELLTDSSKWNKGSFAAATNGEWVPIDSPEAHSFCLVGAVERCYGYFDRFKIFRKIHAHLGDEQGIQDITTWNDSKQRTFKDVKELVETLDI